MKVKQESQRTVYDFTIEEIKEISCPICLAKVEYTVEDIEMREKHYSYITYYTHHIYCPCCKSEIVV